MGETTAVTPGLNFPRVMKAQRTNPPAGSGNQQAPSRKDDSRCELCTEVTQNRFVPIPCLNLNRWQLEVGKMGPSPWSRHSGGPGGPGASVSRQSHPGACSQRGLLAPRGSDAATREPPVHPRPCRRHGRGQGCPVLAVTTRPV